MSRVQKQTMAKAAISDFLDLGGNIGTRQFFTKTFLRNQMIASQRLAKHPICGPHGPEATLAVSLGPCGLWDHKVRVGKVTVTPRSSWGHCVHWARWPGDTPSYPAVSIQPFQKQPWVAPTV